MRTNGAVLSDVNFDLLTALQSKLEAIAAYEAILEDNGEELAALRALDRIYSGEQMWKPLSAIIPRELSLTVNSEPG